jgi:hypothetical protein
MLEGTCAAADVHNNRHGRLARASSCHLPLPGAAEDDDRLDSGRFPVPLS